MPPLPPILSWQHTPVNAVYDSLCCVRFEFPVTPQLWNSFDVRLRIALKLLSINSVVYISIAFRLFFTAFFFLPWELFIYYGFLFSHWAVKSFSRTYLFYWKEKEKWRRARKRNGWKRKSASFIFPFLSFAF